MGNMFCASSHLFMGNTPHINSCKLYVKPHPSMTYIPCSQYIYLTMEPRDDTIYTRTENTGAAFCAPYRWVYTKECQERHLNLLTVHHSPIRPHSHHRSSLGNRGFASHVFLKSLTSLTGADQNTADLGILHYLLWVLRCFHHLSPRN